MPSLSKNKKAYADYEILEEFETGIQLLGPEVKSCKASNCNLKGSYIDIDDKEQIWLNGAHISPYKHANTNNPNPTRKRKLLMHAKEILKIEKKLNEQGVTCVPLEMYTKGSLIKMKIAIVKGKKFYDKRADLKKKAQNLDIARVLKRKVK
jgi:SsrA-binding protein